MQLFDFSGLKIDENNNKFAGISYFPAINKMVGNTSLLTTIVLDNEEYRPDKISDRLWGSQNLSWILDVLNNFETGIIEYTKGTTIQYLSLDRLIKIGMI